MHEKHEKSIPGDLCIFNPTILVTDVSVLKKSLKKEEMCYRRKVILKMMSQHCFAKLNIVTLTISI